MHTTHRIFVDIVFMLNDLGNENEVQLLVHSTNLNAMDENGNSALLLAAERGDELIDREIIIFAL